MALHVYFSGIFKLSSKYKIITESQKYKLCKLMPDISVYDFDDDDDDEMLHSKNISTIVSSRLF